MATKRLNADSFAKDQIHKDVDDWFRTLKQVCATDRSEPPASAGAFLWAGDLALQLLFLRASESMGNHDSNVVGAGRVG